MTIAAKHKLLIIDDEVELLHSLKLSFERENFYVRTCSNVPLALDTIKKEPFDLILTDIEMPIKSGLDFIATLQKSYDISIPIIIMSGKTKIDYLTAAIKLGVVDFISKPINPVELKKVLAMQIYKNKQRRKDFDLKHTIESFSKTFTFTPDDYFHNSISNFLHVEVQKNLNVNLSTNNEIFLILDEAISNAFLHGVWNLSNEERILNKETLIELTKTKKLKKKPVVKVTIEYLKAKNMLRFTVKDTGVGFDYDKYLGMSDVVLINHEASTGRGLSFITALSEKVAFHDGGSMIEIWVKI